MTVSSSKTAEQARKLVQKLAAVPKGTQLKWYITHMRFPRFKNIQRNARMTLDFPVTALVGPNGCGKTSALHALYGAPKGMSTSDYWFATDLDPIKEGHGEPNRFIYGHYLNGDVVETRKARVGKSKTRRLGYFEPTKAVKGDEMDVSPFPAANPKPGQAKDRWNPVERPMTYMNFRSELSAFDKYLFWASPAPTKRYRTKHERLQLGARRLNEVILGDAQSARLRNKQVVFENRDLMASELAAVCSILGREYESARIVRHSYYGDKGLSVQFRTSATSYSEAFAGSGELAVVSLVVQLLSAPACSLILLDEPEVSLHPGAQERLCVFLLSEALRMKHQIVFTTHSEAMIRHLPASAIKVFFEAPTGEFAILDECHPYAAFRHLGAAVPNTIRVLVEDQLAKRVVEAALLNLTEEERSLFVVDFLQGGASSYYKYRVGTLMFDTHPTFLLLDGDQEPGNPFPDPRSIPQADDESLGELIASLTGVEPQLLTDGHGDAAAAKRHELERKFLLFLSERVRFLPKRTPEAIVLEAIGENSSGSSAGDKHRLCTLTHALYGVDTAEFVDRYAFDKLAETRATCAGTLAVTAMLRTMLSVL